MATVGGQAHTLWMRIEYGDDPSVESLMRCPQCDREMRLFGIESAGLHREIYTFECDQCRRLEARSVRLTSE
jgi:hypothetical protein